jgi:hypothetical protein
VDKVGKEIEIATKPVSSASDSSLAEIFQTSQAVQCRMNDVKNIKETVLGLQENKEMLLENVQVIQAKNIECKKRLAYLHGELRNKAEFHRVLSPEAELLRHKLGLRKNALDADFEYATNRIEQVRTSKTNTQNRTLLSICNTAQRIRRSIHQLNLELDKSEDALGKLKNKSAPRPSPSKLMNKKKSGPFGLKGTDVFADESVFEPPKGVVLDEQFKKAKERKLKMIEQLGSRSIELSKPTIRLKTRREFILPESIVEEVKGTEEDEEDDKSVIDQSSVSFFTKATVPQNAMEEQSFEIHKDSFSADVSSISIASKGNESSTFFAVTKPIENVKSGFVFNSTTVSNNKESLSISFAPSISKEASAVPAASTKVDTKVSSSDSNNLEDKPKESLKPSFVVNKPTSVSKADEKKQEVEPVKPLFSFGAIAPLQATTTLPDKSKVTEDTPSSSPFSFNKGAKPLNDDSHTGIDVAVSKSNRAVENVPEKQEKPVEKVTEEGQSPPKSSFSFVQPKADGNKTFSFSNNTTDSVSQNTGFSFTAKAFEKDSSSKPPSTLHTSSSFSFVKPTSDSAQTTITDAKGFSFGNTTTVSAFGSFGKTTSAFSTPAKGGDKEESEVSEEETDEDEEDVDPATYAALEGYAAGEHESESENPLTDEEEDEEDDDSDKEAEEENSTSEPDVEEQEDQEEQQETSSSPGKEETSPEVVEVLPTEDQGEVEPDTHEDHQEVDKQQEFTENLEQQDESTPNQLNQKEMETPVPNSDEKQELDHDQDVRSGDEVQPTDVPENRDDSRDFKVQLTLEEKQESQQEEKPLEVENLNTAEAPEDEDNEMMDDLDGPSGSGFGGLGFDSKPKNTINPMFAVAAGTPEKKDSGFSGFGAQPQKLSFGNNNASTTSGFGSSGFGSTSNSGSSFGGSSFGQGNAFGSSTTGKSPFGSGGTNFGQSTTASAFTASTNNQATSSPSKQENTFGASNVSAFGAPSSSTFGQSGFGSTQSAPGFGQTGFGMNNSSSQGNGSTGSSGPQTSAFGAQGTAAFGKSGFGTSQASPGFGVSAPSTPAQVNAFGANASPAFGQSGFGSSQASPGFGGNAPSTPSNQVNAFGGTKVNAFGGSSTPAFGQSGFGTATPVQVNAFGGTPSSSFGGSSTPAFGQSGFGTPQTSSGFGQTGFAQATYELLM